MLPAGCGEPTLWDPGRVRNTHTGPHIPDNRCCLFLMIWLFSKRWLSVGPLDQKDTGARGNDVSFYYMWSATNGPTRCARIADSATGSSACL